MIRDQRYKYIEYVGHEPQLFDLVEDPGELHDLAIDRRFAEVLSACAAELRQICDPVAVDRQAHEDQRRKIEAHGGEEAIRRSGFQVPFTPAPPPFR